jgi:hypothetical protein
MEMIFFPDLNIKKYLFEEVDKFSVKHRLYPNICIIHPLGKLLFVYQVLSNGNQEYVSANLDSYYGMIFRINQFGPWGVTYE